MKKKAIQAENKKQAKPSKQAGLPDNLSETCTKYPLSWKKRLLNNAGLLLMTLLFIEIISFLAYGIATNQFFSFADLSSKRSLIVQNVPADEGFVVGGLKVPWKVPIHPYYGFGKPQGFDFLQQPDDGIQNDPKGIIVVITGGSVAFGLFNHKKALLQEYLQRIPVFKDKNIHILLLGYLAWKQPQQVTALTYYLAMGGKVDIVINLDGHNEIVDTNTNYKKDVYPAYPWLWYYLASNTISAGELRLIGEIRYWKVLRHSLAEFIDKVAYGVSTNVIWFFFDRLFESGIEQRNIRLSKLQSRDKNSRTFSRFGPDRDFESLQARLEFSSDIWRTSSIQLNRIMKANGGDYFHFLQPNQYVPQSKHFTQQERIQAYDPRRAKAIETGYPYLIAASSQLKAQEVKFFDLTAMFKDVEAAVYRDTCCHFNDFGNELLAREIVTKIAQYYANNAVLTAAE